MPRNPDTNSSLVSQTLTRSPPFSRTLTLLPFAQKSRLPNSTRHQNPTNPSAHFTCQVRDWLSPPSRTPIPTTNDSNSAYACIFRSSFPCSRCRQRFSWSSKWWCPRNMFPSGLFQRFTVSIHHSLPDGKPPSPRVVSFQVGVVSNDSLTVHMQTASADTTPCNAMKCFPLSGSSFHGSCDVSCQAGRTRTGGQQTPIPVAETSVSARKQGGGSVAPLTPHLHTAMYTEFSW